MSNDSRGFGLILPRWLHAGDGDGGGAGDGGGNPGGAGGSTGGGDGGGADINLKIQAAVERATQGLKQNRDQILAEKKQLSEQLQQMQQYFEQLGGKEGIQKLLEMRQRLEKDEMGKLLADGKYDEWFEKRTQSMKSDYEKRIEALNAQLEESNKKAQEAMQRWTDKVLETEVRAACSKAGVIDSAVEDALYRARNMFKYDEERGQMVILDENGSAVLGKDGKSPKSISEWLEEQKQSARHWWPPSQGAGANGALGGGQASPDASAIGRMSMAEYKKFRESQGMGSGRYGIPG